MMYPALHVRPATVIVLSVLYAFSGPAVAQQAASVAWPQTASETLHRHADGTVCATLHIMQLPGQQQALANYHAAKAAGQLPAARKTQESYEIGQVVTFNVLQNLLDSENVGWEEHEFTLVAQNDVYCLWASDFDLQDDTITDDDIARLAQALGESTPDGSFNPNQGVIENDNTIFGAPPNYDGDGKVDVLLYDITEGTDNGTVILGYVVGTDLDPNAAAGEGNQGDILYLDSTPGLRRSGENDIGSTAAHEYQHLIHFAYDPAESSFVNEGLSEWAQTLNGYDARSAVYLQQPGNLYNINLFEWRRGTTQVLDDYARASIFTTYFAEQVGREIAGSLTRVPQSDFFGYQALFNNNTGLDLTIEDLIANFHTANIINDTSVDPRFGYQAPQRQREVRVRPRRIVDGSTVNKTPPTDLPLQPGGAEYVVWQNVADFNVVVDIQNGNNTTRSFIRPRLILERTDGTTEVQDLTPDPLPASFAGVFNEVILVVPHVRAAATPVRFEYSADWGGTGRQLISVQYDNGQHQNGTAFTLGSAERGAQATRFEVPEGAAISKVLLANFYRSQFDGTGIPTTAPRDFTLKVWADNGEGLPGEELFSQTFEDPRPAGPPLIAFEHFELDIEASAESFFPLPDVVYIGYEETGTDENYMVVAPATYNEENTSFIRGVNAGTGETFWIPLWEVQFQSSEENEFPLENTTLATRVEFVIDPTITDVEDEPELPNTLALHANYPNPFNPATRIQYTLPEAAPVQVAIYDVTGRLMRVLADGLQPAGTHTVTLDATSWASGVYFYTLASGADRLTRKMLLLK